MRLPTYSRRILPILVSRYDFYSTIQPLCSYILQPTEGHNENALSLNNHAINFKRSYITAWYILPLKYGASMPTEPSVRLDCFTTAACLREPSQPGGSTVAYSTPSVTRKPSVLYMVFTLVRVNYTFRSTAAIQYAQYTALATAREALASPSACNFRQSNYCTVS